jgi:hypothetical protein
MKGKFHGITSILFIFISLVIGLYQIYIYSMEIAIIYGAILLIGSFLIINTYCTKCPCKNTNCAHVLPGFIAKFLPDKEPGKYKKSEIAIVIIIVIIWLAVPQYWLAKSDDFMLIFWLLIITGFYQIVRFVCSKCDNKYCMANKKKHEEK